MEELSGMKIGDIFIAAIKIMKDYIGTDSIISREHLTDYMKDEQYKDRLMGMLEVINRGLLAAKIKAYIPSIDSYEVPIEEFNIPLYVGVALPFWIKYELYQDDNDVQAYKAREEFEKAISIGRDELNTENQTYIDIVYKVGMYGR